MDYPWVVVRGPAGVYVGELVSEDVGAVGNVTLRNAFCLWYYAGAASLSQLAVEGVKKPDECKFSIDVPEMRLKSVFQVIPLSLAARLNLCAVRRWKI